MPSSNIQLNNLLSGLMKISSKFFLVYLHFPFFCIAQNWSPWTNIKSNTDNSIQYCYKLYPVTSGNSFSFKIKNNSLAVVCGEFDVYLNMINGRQKVPCLFKDLKPGIEKSCPGVYQFADVQSFGSITNVKINNCGEEINAQSTPASFTISFHNDVSKGGKFKYIDPTGQCSFEAAAYSGQQKASNNPYSQSFKNQGVIPSGTWTIELITTPKTNKEKELNKYPPIFRLTPMGDVEQSSLKSKEFRDGFLIHSGKNPLTASQGCIILDNASRQKLKAAILKYGAIKMKVQNKVY
ncbi:MAG: DUF2778 domain-containing protein [Agriterribacter sp.]